MSKKIISHFKKVDPTLHEILEKVYALHGDELFNLKKHNFLFDRLVESIISQQLSVRVADVIYERVLNLLPDKQSLPISSEKGKKLTPENILRQNDEDLRKCGLSYGKIKYIKDLSDKVKTGELNLDNLENLDDAEVINELTKVKGVGKWTAEMFLMFALGRPDIFSHGDLGLKNAIKKIYKLEKYDPILVEEIIIKWSPFKTFAARILWKSLELK